MAVLQGLGMSRNPADFNRRFAINEKKKPNKTGDIICYVDGRYVVSEYWEEWARYRPGVGVGEGVGEGDGEHVTWHAEVGNPPFEFHSPCTMSVLLSACFTAMARTFY